MSKTNERCAKHKTDKQHNNIERDREMRREREGGRGEGEKQIRAEIEVI